MASNIFPSLNQFELLSFFVRGNQKESFNFKERHEERLPPRNCALEFAKHFISIALFDLPTLLGSKENRNFYSHITEKATKV